MNDQQNTQNTDARDSLEASIDRQLGLYRKLVKLVARQRDLVAEDEPSRLLSLLAQRRQVTDELTDVIHQTGPLDDRLKEMRPRLSNDDSRRIELKTKEVDAHLSAIMAADNEDVRRLEIRKNQLRGDLGTMPARGAMLSAYGQSSSARSGVLDRTDEPR